ncbi:hypothetical protein AEAC466_02770 [Asticcacaulis sp. AC466]|nr:hypothetical protein AEAC466_02770 [Asticcacaulis sp. AC466]
MFYMSAKEIAVTISLIARPDHPGFTSETMAVKRDFSEVLPILETFKLGDLTVEATPGRDAL